MHMQYHGLIAGLLNKFGRIGVVIGFIIGNIVLSYASNGYTVEVIYLKEILIASIALFVIPKKMKIDIEEFVGNRNLLPLGMNRGLTTSKQTVDKLNNVSDTLNQMISTFDLGNSKIEIKDKRNKQNFVSELLNGVEPYKRNIFYSDMVKQNSDIVNKIFETLVDKQELDKEDIIKIYKDCNTYIVGLSDEILEAHLQKDLNQIIKAINVSYKIAKNNIVCDKKIEENKKNLKTQLEGVSNVITTIAEDITKETKQDTKYLEETKIVVEKLKDKEIVVKQILVKKDERFVIDILLEQYAKTEIIEDILTKVFGEKIVLNNEASKGKELVFVSDDKYIMALAEVIEAKFGEDISGDNILKARLKDGKYVVALSDGMGSGVEANKSSKATLGMLEKMVLSGFNKKSSIDLITASLINRDDEKFATLDIAIIDLYLGKIEFIKSGTCPTYIKNRNKVQLIKSTSLPLGIVNRENSNIEVFEKDILEGEIMMMCTDGILEANIEYKNKELWVKYLLEDIETTNTKKIADLIKAEAIDNNYGKAKDDMSIVVCKFVAKDV